MDKNIKEWHEVCQKFCEDRGYELLFVNTDNFGFADKDGNLYHWDCYELAEYLKKEDK